MSTGAMVPMGRHPLLSFRGKRGISFLQLPGPWVAENGIPRACGPRDDIMKTWDYSSGPTCSASMHAAHSPLMSFRAKRGISLPQLGGFSPAENGIPGPCGRGDDMRREA
jgi:hypothetical protein